MKSRTVLVVAEIDETCNILRISTNLINTQTYRSEEAANVHAFDCPNCRKNVTIQLEIGLSQEEDSVPLSPDRTETETLLEEEYLEESPPENEAPVLKVEVVQPGPSFEASSEDLTEYFKLRKQEEPQGDFKCDLCERSFRTKYSCRIHKNIHSSKYRCTICDAAHTRAGHLSKHMRREHTEEEQILHVMKAAELRREEDAPVVKLPEGEELDMIATHQKKVNLAKVLETLPKSTHCFSCSVAFASMEELYQHFKAVHGDDYFACGVCQKVLRSKKTFKQHLVRYHVDKNDETMAYTCNFANCGAKYMLQRDLKMHISKKHGDREKRREVVETRALICHLRTHDAQKPFKCDVCHKGFVRMATLKMHMLTHTKFRKYTCQTCGQSYIRKSYLKIHERIHAGERPYGCDRVDCGKRFYDKGSLRQHRMMHQRREAMVVAETFAAEEFDINEQEVLYEVSLNCK